MTVSGSHSGQDDLILGKQPEAPRLGSGQWPSWPGQCLQDAFLRTLFLQPPCCLTLPSMEVVS